MSILFPIARRVLFGMDPERAHNLTIRALAHPALARIAAVKVPDNPVEIAPGMVFFLHMILMDSDSGTAMTLGRTSLVTQDGAEVLSRLPLDLVSR